ncbi:MAG: hypothetical protein COA45_00020 [Zetaproteobacteria bacterium]|nr:MAG: hypothetical protein COA45_00020 [Zetaproteobacteria bacterium]
MENITFLSEEKINLSVAIVGAFIVHIFVLGWILPSSTQNNISSEIFSPPTNVSIRFVSPVKKVQPTVQHREVLADKPTPKKKAKPIIKKVEKKPIVPPPLKTFNKIEPITPQATKIDPPITTKQENAEFSKAVQNVIPVINEINMKGRRIQPKYPKRSIKMRQEGIVLLHVLISKVGKRIKIKIHKPSQYALLNKAALKAVKKWTFSPYVVNGVPVRSWVEIPIEFKIQ